MDNVRFAKLFIFKDFVSIQRLDVSFSVNNFWTETTQTGVYYKRSLKIPPDRARA